MAEIFELVDGLGAKNTKTGCGCLKRLEELSAESNEVYAFFNVFAHLISDPNSYIRTRGLLLIAANARWDCENRLYAIIGEYLEHITDEKPITARQCIQSLPEITRCKPKLKDAAEAALKRADTSKYNDSMRPLIEKDIKTALSIISAQ